MRQKFLSVIDRSLYLCCSDNNWFQKSDVRRIIIVLWQNHDNCAIFLDSWTRKELSTMGIVMCQYAQILNFKPDPEKPITQLSSKVFDLNIQVSITPTFFYCRYLCLKTCEFESEKLDQYFWNFFHKNWLLELILDVKSFRKRRSWANCDASEAADAESWDEATCTPATAYHPLGTRRIFAAGETCDPVQSNNSLLFLYLKT